MFPGIHADLKPQAMKTMGIVVVLLALTILLAAVLIHAQQYKFLFFPAIFLLAAVLVGIFGTKKLREASDLLDEGTPVPMHVSIYRTPTSSGDGNATACYADLFAADAAGDADPVYQCRVSAPQLLSKGYLGPAQVYTNDGDFDDIVVIRTEAGIYLKEGDYDAVVDGEDDAPVVVQVVHEREVIVVEDDDE